MAIERDSWGLFRVVRRGDVLMAGLTWWGAVAFVGRFSLVHELGKGGNYCPASP